MRAASDLHLAPHTAQWVFEALLELRADAEAHGGPTILAGDIWDQPRTVDVGLLNRLRDALRAFPDRVIVIPGNHDQYDGWRNACEALHGDNVFVASEPEYIVGVGTCLPYMDPARWLTTLQSVRGASPLVFAHQGFAGAYLNNLMRDRKGIRVSEGLQGLVVVTGHYHAPQNVAQVVYCGSPYQTTHAETGQTKGYLRWSDKPRTSWVDWLPERVPYERVTAPRYWTIEWSGSGPVPMPEGHRVGDIVRVRAPQIDAAELQRVGLQGAAHVPPTPATIEPATRLGEQLSAYLDGLDSPGIDLDDLRAYMEEEKLWPAE